MMIEGLRKKPTYDQLINYLGQHQEKIKYPNLLYKPVRSSYYMLRANFSTMGDDLDKAEADLKKGLATGMPEKEYEGTAYLQLGSISYKKGTTEAPKRSF